MNPSSFVKGSITKLLAVAGRQLVPFRDPFADMCQLVNPQTVRVVIDGGAYHGNFSIKLARLFPKAKVYAFEPAESSYRVLVDNVRFNLRVQPVNLALSSASGIQELYYTSYGQTAALTPPGSAGQRYYPGRMRVDHIERVQSVTLDEWAEREGVTRVDVIKLDLEGHELAALQGAGQRVLPSARLVYTEVRFVEMHQGSCLFCQVADYLQAQGFYLYNLYHLAADLQDKRLLWGDALFVNERLNGIKHE